MTKLERRIARIAEATGQIVAVGRQGHKDEWFATCGGVEWGGPSAMAALDAVVASLQTQATTAAHEAARANERAAAIRDLLA